MSDENFIVQDSDEEESGVNILEKAGVVDDDLLEQAKDMGKATLEFGKKTGKLLFNATRIGLTKLKEKAEEIAESRQK